MPADPLPIDHSTNQHAALERLHGEIRACRRCVDAGYLPQAVPIFRGRPGQRLMVVGQAPGIRAAPGSVPWSGPSGVLLRGWLARIGIDKVEWLDRCYLTSVTKCFPGRPAAGGGDRAPSRKEQALCRPFLDAEIGLVRPGLVITLGRIAAETLVPALRGQPMTAMVGHVFQPDLGYGPVPLVPLPHPSGVSRWLNDPANRTLVDTSLVRLRDLYAQAGQ